jgi:ubiquinone/menaquinone biosynthesis C-methylase UbiE
MRKFIQFGFYHFYHSFAWTYDIVAAIVSRGRWRDWGRAALPYVTGLRILEIGFGPGHLQVELNQEGRTAFGLDESAQMNRRAQAALRRESFSTRLARGYAQSLPFASASFDSVLTTFPSQYIADLRTHAELLRVLRPGGRLVVLPVAGLHSPGIYDRLAKWLFHITAQNAEVSPALETHFRDMFADEGFNVQVTPVEIRDSTVLIVVAEKPA